MSALRNEHGDAGTPPNDNSSLNCRGSRTGVESNPAIETESARWLKRAAAIIEQEADALQQLAASISPSFAAAVGRILDCRGKVVVTGVGKAGLVGRKLAASLSSTGTPAHFLHPVEAVHGDLGCVQSTDVVVLLSYSGETAEVNQLLAFFRSNASGTIAITSSATSTLGSSVDIVLPLGHHSEACQLGLAPTTSTTLMMAMADALTIVVSEARGFTRQQFATFHPAGSLGRRLAPVTHHMRRLEQCRITEENKTVREVLVAVSRPGRRTGCIMIVNQQGRLSGLFTDSDLARLLESRSASVLDTPITRVMTRQFITIGKQAKMWEAIEILRERKISELPVIDDDGRPLGLLDITDLVGLLAGKEEDRDEETPPDIFPLPSSGQAKAG